MEETGYILAIDQGTTSTRAILVNKASEIIAMSDRPTNTTYRKSGWVEQDAVAIYEDVVCVAREVMDQAAISPVAIVGIGLSNQRETTVVWDKATGIPIHPAIVWQSRQSEAICAALRKDHSFISYVKEQTGLVVDPYFSATKVRWILDEVPGAQARAEAGELLFGTIETWLIWKLTAGAVHVSEYSNASRTMLFNIKTLTWDAHILHLLNIPMCMLPDVKDSSCCYGQTASHIFGAPIVIAGALGDQQASLFGQACFNPGSAKNTYGTGCFLLLHTGTERVVSQQGLLTTIAWGKDGSVHYALEGSVFAAGATMKWLRDELGLLRTVAESAAYATQISSSEGVYVVPAFVGLGAPYWESATRGTIFGLTLGTTKAHIIRAALEATAFQVSELLEVMQAEAGVTLTQLRVDGGGAANPFLMQFQSDILQRRVAVAQHTESTAIGAAYIAGLASGFWANESELAQLSKTRCSYDVQMPQEERQQLMAGWQAAVCATIAYRSQKASHIVT